MYLRIKHLTSKNYKIANLIYEIKYVYTWLYTDQRLCNKILQHKLNIKNNKNVTSLNCK